MKKLLSIISFFLAVCFGASVYGQIYGEVIGDELANRRRPIVGVYEPDMSGTGKALWAANRAGGGRAYDRLAIDPSLLDVAGAAFKESFVGRGLTRLGNWVKSQSAEYEEDPNYDWREDPYIDFNRYPKEVVMGAKSHKDAYRRMRAYDDYVRTKDVLAARPVAGFLANMAIFAAEMYALALAFVPRIRKLLKL